MSTQPDADHALAEEVTVQHSPVLLQAALQELSPRARPWRIDAGGLRRFDSSCLALLMELRRRAGAGGLELLRAPERLRTLAEAYGVGFVLDGGASEAPASIGDPRQQ